jgi:hypothetical protein
MYGQFTTLPNSGGGGGGGPITINGTTGTSFTYTTGTDSCIDWTSPFAPTYNFACLMGRANTWSGANDYSGGRIRLPESALASIPAASSITGQIFRVTDSTATQACRASSVLCVSNGTTNLEIGAGGSGGGATVTGTSVLKGSGGNAVPATAADVVALFGSGSCSGYLKSDGTCSVVSSSATAHYEYWPMASYANGTANTTKVTFGGWSGTAQFGTWQFGLGTNQAIYSALFPTNGTASMFYSWILPPTWDGQSIPVKLYVYTDNQGGAASGTIQFTIYSTCPSQSTSTSVMSSSYTWTNSVNIQQAVTAVGARFVMSGTLPMSGCSAGNPVTFQVFRQGNTAPDTLVNAVGVIGMQAAVTY